MPVIVSSPQEALRKPGAICPVSASRRSLIPYGFFVPDFVAAATRGDDYAMGVCLRYEAVASGGDAKVQAQF